MDLVRDVCYEKALNYLLALWAQERSIGTLLKFFVKALSAESVSGLGEQPGNQVALVGELPAAHRAHQLFKHGGWYFQALQKQL